MPECLFKDVYMFFKSCVVTVALSLGLVSVAAADEGQQPHHQMVMNAGVPVQKAWGMAGDTEKVERTIEIKMDDRMRFSPDHIAIKQGETIRFVLPNDGQVQHEFVLGEKALLDKFADDVVKGKGMLHGETGMAHVAPGERGEVVWTFNRVGEFDFACLIAGHYQSGMVGKISVTAQ
ncbi:cupredoxin family protein [Ectopseudomonas mendocina]|uniref:Cupredoxin family protein n=1 Tax=Ectopseudomonas mendocina TaxID=300 RepID=A0ABZ2RDQ3_ECTME